MKDNTAVLHELVKTCWREHFGRSGRVRIARAPGRVNIIGEHTDYNGLPVMPAAIDREIAIAFAPSDDAVVRLINLDPRFGGRVFELSDEIEPYGPGDWGNYAKAAAQALWGWAQQNSPSSLPLVGIDGCAGGSIPAGSGLSSSSALVVAAALALVEANDLPITREELASLLASGEQYVGTQGGGMDQAASLLSQPESLLRIDFDPLRTTPVPVPEDAVFVIANSLVRAEKSGAARLAYNTRVAECRLGVRMLAALFAGDHPELAEATLLGDVYRWAPDWQSLIESLPDGALTLGDAAAVAGIPADTLREQCLRTRTGAYLSVGSFAVKRRVRHVLSEARRVHLAEAALASGDLAGLGRVMDASHESCAHDYEVSCPGLDDLVDALRANGAIGARLTGAGFGGCAVALVERQQAQDLVERVWLDYYEPTRIATALAQDQIIFACRPSGGAGLVASVPTGADLQR